MGEIENLSRVEQPVEFVKQAITIVSTAFRIHKNQKWSHVPARAIMINKCHRSEVATESYITQKEKKVS